MSKFSPYSLGRAAAKREIQSVLDKQGKNFLDVAIMAGVCKQTVSATVNGHRHSPQVLDALRSLGVPEKYLFDPRRSPHAA